VKTFKPNLSQTPSLHVKRSPWGSRVTAHMRDVILFNKARVEDPRGILNRLYGKKSVLENIISCDRVFEIYRLYR
jgi:hypothetical protein